MIGAEGQSSALEIARLTRWRGEKRTARVLLALFLLGVVALVFAPWQQTAVGRGEVLAWSPNERALEVQAPIEGRVARWHFIEGDHVEQGEVLVELADNDPEAIARYERQRAAVARRADATRGAVVALEERIEALRSLRDRTLESARALVDVQQSQREAAALDLEAAEAKWRAAALQLERVELLYADGLASERDLEVARRDAARALAELEAARATVEAAVARVASRRAEREAKAAELSAEIAGARNALEAERAKIAAIEADLASVERALARQRSLEVRAPRSGMLTRVKAREGSAYVQQGERLATVVAEADERAVELYVRGVDAPLVVPGQRVRLQFQGWPAFQFGGWPEAAVGTFPGEVAFVSAQASPSGRYRVLIRPRGPAGWPPSSLLRQGNEAVGWILLDRVALGYELWRQLNGFPADFPAEAAEAAGYR